MAALQALSSCAVVLLLLVPEVYTASAQQPKTTLQTKCEKYGAGTPSDYDFCVKTMLADGVSPALDARGLAVTATRIAKRIALATEKKVEAELRDGGAGRAALPKRRDCLSKCAARYAATVRGLRRAATTMDLQDAQDMLGKAYGAPVVCNDAFKKAGLPAFSSPITAADRRVDDVINMAITFLH